MQTDVETRGIARIRLRRLAFALNLALFAVVFGVPLQFPQAPLPWTTLQLGWCGLYALTTLVCVFSRCPRCEQLFHSVYPTDNPFARSCRGCGLSLSEPNA